MTYTKKVEVSEKSIDKAFDLLIQELKRARGSKNHIIQKIWMEYGAEFARERLKRLLRKESDKING